MIKPKTSNIRLSEYKAEFMLLIVTLTWGVSFPMVKLLLEHVSPFLLVLIRFAITLIFFVIIYHKEIFVLKFEDWKPGLILGVLLFAGYVFQTIGLVYTTASNSAFITGINLIFIPFIQYLVLRLKPGLFNVIGAALVITGLFILTGMHLGIQNPGDVLTIFCALSFAVHIVLLSKYSLTKSFVSLAFGQFLAIPILGIPAVLLLEPMFFGAIRFDASELNWFYLLFTSVVSTLLSLVLMVRYQPLTTPFRAGIIYNFEAVFAVVFSFFMLGEMLTGTQFAGMIVMGLGLLLSELSGMFKMQRG